MLVSALRSRYVRPDEDRVSKSISTLGLLGGKPGDAFNGGLTYLFNRAMCSAKPAL